MPIYNLNGKRYDIPENLAGDFEKDNPGASIDYNVGGKEYSIPLDQRESFLADFPDAVSGEQKKTESYKPTAQEMADFNATIRSGQRLLDNMPNMQQGIDKVQQRAKQRAGINVPQRVNVGETNNLRTEQHLNPETGELEDTYITEGLHEYGNKTMAEQEQQVIDQYRRDQQYKQSLPGQLDMAYQERDRINQMLAERREQILKENGDKSFLTRLLEEFGKASRSDKLPEETAIWKDFDNDKDYNALMAAARKNKAIITALEDQKNQETDSFWHSLATDITNGYNLSVGGKSTAEDFLAQADARLKLDDINKKREKGEELTHEEEVAEAVLKNSAWDQMVQAKYGDSYGAWARAGKMTATSLDLMFDLMAMGGNPMSLAKEIYTGVSRWGGEKLGEMATKGLGKYMMKALGATLGSMVAGAEVTNTIQLPKTLSNTLKNVQGDVYYDENGNYVFGHYEDDEAGEPVFVEGGESFLGSFLDAERQGIAENASEIAGTFLEGAGPLVLKVLEKVGLSKIANKITALTGKSWYKAYSEALETMGFNGVPGEALEEYTGDIFSLIMGDPTGIVGDKNGRGGWTDLDKHIDIWLGCATMGGLLNAPRMLGTGYSTAQYYRYKHAAEKASQAAASVFDSEEWQLLQEAIDGATNEQMKNVALSIRTDDNLNNEQKASALKYIESVQKMRGYNLGRIAAEREGDDDPALLQADHAYAEGYNSRDPQDMNAAKNQLEMSKFWLGEIVSDDMMAQFESNPIEALRSIINNTEWTPEEKQTAMDYVNARMTYDGMLDGVRDDIEGKIEVSNNTIDQRTNQNDGMVHRATLKDDKQVYIVSGNVLMDDSGANVDVNASKQATGGDNMILTIDSETGKLEAHAIDEFMTVDQPMDANQMKAEAAENIRQTTAQEAADKIDGKLAFQPNDQYQILDEQGVEHTVQIVQDYGDGTVLATIDGAAEPIPMAMQDVQTMADAYNQAKVMQQQAEIQAERNAESASLAEGEEQQLEQQPQEPEQKPTAMDKIPVKSNERGEPIINKRGEKTYMWHQAPVADTADALAEMTGDDMLMARDTAASMIENAKQDLEKANKLKPQGRDPLSIIESRKNIAAAQQQARDVVKYWQDVQTEINRRMKQAEAERRSAEEAAKSEEQRAAEAARQAEIAAKQAEIAAQRRREEIEKARKERTKPYAPLQRAKKDMAGYPEAEEILNDAEPRDLAEWVSHLLRPHSLLWEDEKVGDHVVTGLQSELGLQKKDFERIGTLLGKRKDGALPFAEVVDEIHEGLPEGMKQQYTDQDVRNALLDLFNEGDVNRMLHLAEEHRIEEAQQAVEEMRKREEEAEMDAWTESHHLNAEERESFEAFMQEPPSAVEQDIINQIIAEHESDRTSERVDSQPDSGTDAGAVETGESQVQQTVEAAGDEIVEQTNEPGAEAATGEQTATDNTVFGERKVETERAAKLRADLANAYSTGDIAAIQQAVNAIQAYINEGGDFEGPYREEADDYEGTEPDMLTEQYITHALLDYYLDDDEEYIRTGLRKDLREAIQQDTDIVKFGKIYTSNLGDTPSQVIFEEVRENEKTGQREYVAIARDPETGTAVRFQIKEKDLQDNLANGMYVETSEDAPTNLEVKEQELQFQEPTAKSSIQGLENYSEQEIVDMVMNYFDQVCSDMGADADIVDVKIIGSRVNGNADEDSDLDVLVEYDGNAREDALFNALANADEPLVIDGVVVDINPINKYKSGTIQQFLERNADYKKEVDKQPQQLGETSTPEEIAAEEAKVNTEPTEAQKEAGNYEMGHIKVDGYDITIENPKGSVRRGTDANGKQWEQTMHNTYGYIRATEGVDGDHIDVFLSDNPTSGKVYIIDQVDPKTGEFDEHKVMYGFESEEAAREAYLSNYEEGWQGLGEITEVPRDIFKKWIEQSRRKTKMASEYKMLQKLRKENIDIPAEVTDQIAEYERLHDEYYKLSGTADNEEYKKKSEELSNQLNESRRKLVAALRTLTTNQLLKLKDAYKDNGGVIYRHVTNEIHERQIFQQMANIYDAGAEKQGKVEGKANSKPAKTEEYTEQGNPNRQVLSGMYHDPDGYGVVSDGFVLLADKQAYDKAHKGEILTVGKDAGKKVDGEYPNWKLLVDSNTEGYQKAKVNVDRLLDFVAGVEDKLKAEWKAEKDAKQTKMSFKDWIDYAEVFLKMPDGSVISFRPQRLKLFAQGMKQIGASEIEYLNIYNKVFARSKNGVALVMPLANYDTWSQDGDVHRYFYDLSEGKAPTKQSWNTNVAENYSNISNGAAQSQDNDVTLPKNWQELPTNDVDNEQTGEHVKGLRTLLKENFGKLLKAYGKWNDRGSIVGLQQARAAIQAELDKRERKYKEWRSKYNIDEKGRISLDDLSRLFSDLNSNKKLAKLFEKVAQTAKQIGLDIRFYDDLQSAGASTYKGRIGFLTGYLTSSGLDNQYVAGILLHELIHSVTQSTVSAYKAGGEKAAALTESQKKAAQKIIDIYDKLKEYADKNGLDDYGFKNPHEMIADLSKASFRNTLRSIKLKEKKSLWEILKDAFHGIFGLTKDRNVLSEVSKALDDLLDNFSMQTFESMRDHQGDNWSTLKEVEKTLMGVHNIPEYKLRKVLKQGGLANPSLAVVDTKNHIHTDYGEISLIPRSSLIDARKGRNAGTFTADAWTATYPQVLKKMTNKGWDKFYKDTREIEKYEDGGEDMASKIRMAWDSYLDGREPSELYWWYLLDRGHKPEAVRYQNEYGTELSNEVTKLATDENGSDIDVSQLPDEAIKRLAELKRQYEIQQGEEKKPVEERIAAARASMEGKNEVFRANRQKMIDELEKYGDTIGNIKSWVSKVVWAGRREGQLDQYGTTLQAQREVQKNHASDYQAWLLEKEGEYEVQEKLFAGTDDYTGRQKWVANTLANASKLMKKQGLNGAIGWSSLGEWIAKVAKRVTTLADIRKERKNLNTTKEQHDAFKDKWGTVLHGIAEKIAADGDMWSGEARLTEALEHTNPADYIQREYGINLPKKDRAAIDKFIKEVRENFPTGYFETKFQRPVYLNEFAVAVVPDTTSPDIISALKREGLKVSTYQMDNVGNPNDENRRQAVMKAAQDEGDILFRDDEEGEEEHDIFYSNAMYAVENIAQDKATPEQWLAMLQKQGGLKAGEDKWLGLTDWLNDQKKAGVKSLTRQQLIDYINENQIQVEETRYSGNIDVDNIPKMIEFRKEFDEILDKLKDKKNNLEAEMEDFNDRMYEKYGDGWFNQLNEEEQETYNSQEEEYGEYQDGLTDLAFQEMTDRYGDDFGMAFEYDYGSGKLEPAVDMYGDGMSDAAKHYLEMDERPIDDVRIKYTTGGLDNNREIALTVPTIEPYNESDYVHFGDAGEGRAVAWVRFGDTVVKREPTEQELAERISKMPTAKQWEKVDGSNFVVKKDIYYMPGTRNQVNHSYIVDNGNGTFEIGGPMARRMMTVKFPSLEDAVNAFNQAWVKGRSNNYHEKVLVIDEIQSKRHQDAREKGYKGDRRNDTNKSIVEVFSENGYEIKRDDKGIVTLSRNGEAFKPENLSGSLLALYDAYKYGYDKNPYTEEDYDEDRPPIAPFEKNWHELAMKRMLRYAAENGYDKIAWTTGAQQAERYNLSDKVDEIKVAGGVDNIFTVIGIKDGGILVQEDVEGEKGLAELIGKDMARKAYSNLKEGKEDYLNEDGAVSFTGDDLVIGGEGMKGFYDDILPRFMNKYGKKWGVKVGTVHLPELEQGSEDMWSIDVTPEMRESVMQGQPLFRLDDEADNSNKSDILATISDNITPAEVEDAMNSRMLQTWLRTGKSKDAAQKRGWDLFGAPSIVRDMAKARLGIDTKWDFASVFYNPAEYVAEYIKQAAENGLSPQIAEKYDFRDGDVIQSIINSGEPMYTQDELNEIAKYLKPGAMNQFLSAVQAFGDERKIRKEINRLETYDEGDAMTKALAMMHIAVNRLKQKYEKDERFFKPVTYIKGKNGVNEWGTDTHYYPDYQPKVGEEVETRYHLRNEVARELSKLIATSPVNMKNLKLEGQPMFRNNEDIEEINDKFNKELQQQIDGTLLAGHIYEIGNPSDILLEAGIPDLPIQLAASRLVDKSAQDNHPFKLEEVKDLPKAIQEPLAVFRSATHIGSFVVLTELKHGDRSFVAAIEANKKLGKIEVNSIRSVHYRTGLNIVNWITEDLGEYFKPGFVNNWLQQIRNELRSKPQYNSADVRAKLNSAANIVQKYETSKKNSENLLREGKNNQEPQQKVEKKRTAAEQRSREAFAERQRRRAVDVANETVEKLNLQDKVTILDNADGLTGRYKKAKGWYDRATGKIVIVIDNHKSPTDVMATILHEGVAHYGLRKLFGGAFDQFLKNVYDHSAFDIKVEIADMAARLRARDRKYGRTIKTNEQYQMDATEEFLAKLAEDTDFERAMNQGWWQQIKQWFVDMCRKVGLADFEGELTDNELRYILWRSYENLAEPGRYRNVFEQAEYIAKDEEMKRKLGVRREKERERLQKTGKTDTSGIAAQAAEPDKAELFRDDDENEDEEDDEDNIMHFNAGRPTLEETIINGLMKLARDNANNVQLRIDAMKAIGGNLSKLRQAMSRQRAYDKDTVMQIVRLARSIMDNGYIDKLTRGEVKKLIGLIAGAAGKEDITTAAKKVVDMLVGNQLRQVKELLQKQLAIRGTKIDNKGVEVQGQLDIEGVRLARALKDGMSLTEEALAERIDDCLDRMGSTDDTISQAASAEYQGYILAQQYIDEVRKSETEESNLKYEKKRAREDYDAGRLTKEQYNEFVETIDDTILTNQLERIRGYYDLLANVGDALGRSTKRAKEFRDKEIAHVREIQHNANSDMEGRAYDEHHKPTWMEKAANWSFVRFFMKPLATFDQMLRLFGSKSVNGEGYLWSRFMNGYTEASDKEWKHLYQDYQELDKKVSEVFGKKMKWSDLFSIERKMKGMEVEFWDGGQRKSHTLTPGNLLYIYMANKMADGRMKLRKMGITEDDVTAIKEHLDPRFIELADWLQNEYLPEKRVYYNSVHEDLFGASMAAIDNYFPLVINKRDLSKEEEVGSEDYLGDDKIGATITGNIIKRTKNAKALDITNADAFDVILHHLQQMEHWAAYAPINKDLGALLSYKHFRNQVLNMKSLQYGSGQNLWVNFKRACAVVSGAYRPKIDKDSVDTSLVNLAKGVTAAKISLRLFTALKQLLSYPAYLSEASLIQLAKYTNPIGAVVSFNWAIDNLPGFSKRWQSRIAGDTRLQDTDVDWSFWKNKIVKGAAKIGMMPNAFIDAITVAMGAKAIYETKKKQYLTDGYSEEQAEKKALNAASISFNETQQSSEQAFISAMQLDRTVASVALTVFRNASMGYQRRLTGALRNLTHMMAPGYRKRSIDFMAKQMQRDGLTEQQAERAAKRAYNRSWYKNIADVLIFGYVMQLAWNLGPYLPYLIGGDDDDEKDKMLEDAMMHALAGGVEGLTGGAQMSEIYNLARSGGDVSSYQFNLLPLMSDVQQTLRHFKSDDVAAWNDVINLLIQSGIGVNPQTLTDAFVAIQDAAEGDPETSKEIAILIMRIMQMPQGNIDKMMIDELGLTGEEARKLDAEALAKRWAAYKRRKNAPLTGWAYRDEEEAEVEKKYVDKFTKKIKERFAGKNEDDLQSMMNSESDEFMKELIQKELVKTIEATLDEQDIHIIESDFNATHDSLKRKLMSRRIARSTGASRDPYGSKSDKEYGLLYQELRTANDVREDAELLKLQEDAKNSGDQEKADEISKERQSVRKNIRGMERGNTEANIQDMEDLRKERKELLEKYGLR